MGNRLSKIYTRTGDQGQTGLGDGSRVAKDDARIEAIGSIDELNSVLGVLASESQLPDDIGPLVQRIQNKLFDLGGELCIPGHQMIDDADAADLERALDSLNEDLPALKEFILPGGARSAACCHMARSVCRRAERRLVSLADAQPVNAPAVRYLNRLSDLLFVMARTLNRRAGHDEVLWKRD